MLVIKIKKIYFHFLWLYNWMDRSRTLGAASPPRVHFPFAWLFLYRLAPFHTYHRRDRDRLRNRLIPLRRSVVVLVCILVALSAISRARRESCAILIETARRRRRRRSWERRRDFFCFVCALFFLYFLVCFLCFSEFFFWCGKRAWLKQEMEENHESQYSPAVACM
jgi:hypothetical protein